MTQHHTALIDDDEGLFQPVREFSEPLDASPEYIRSSPYHEQEHQLQLDTLDVGYRSLALALQSFVPVNGNKDYQYEEYEKAFPIKEIVERAQEYSKLLGEENLPELTAYVIGFRSILHVEVQESAEKRSISARIDKGSHTEANISGGLLKYWFGTPDDENAKNLATCWWTNREAAKIGGGGKTHREGMALVKSWYKHWQVEEYELHVLPRGEGYTFGPVSKR
ncbi:hypothetical protein CAAN1_14S04500 [[Candida] anglica]|uniref:Uncharacterized protein n=1 Tax=[Candida] anglica TaxID=148631 RepID=A0ABP0EMM7_9ASCO